MKEEDSEFQKKFKLFLNNLNLESNNYLKNDLKTQDNDKKKFNCFFCDEIFISNKNFESHLLPIKRKKRKNSNLECDFCKISFITKCGLRYHVVLNHRITCKLRCHKCENRFENFSSTDFKIHMEKCGQSSPTNSIKLKQNSQHYKCSNSPKKFSIKKSLNFRNAENKIFSCKICKKTFITKKLLDKHACSKKSKNKFQCPRCLKKYAAKSYLVKHIFNCDKKS